MRETFFDQTYTAFNNDETNSEQIDPLNLKRCLRIHPEDMNTGGFFIAVIEKTFDYETD
jgi:16S rRNA C967 or C1407 C5-methylase (RsmB/RsmF family)